MIRKTIPVLAAVLLAAIFLFDACKKAAVETYTVTVTVSVGVSGTPLAGTYYLDAGNQLTYSYELNEGYAKLTVLLDGKEVEASGTITVSGDHTMRAYSDANTEFTLTVTRGTGVNGTPETGTYTYAQGALVDYSYVLADGYSYLLVKLDGVDVESHGTITMSEDYSLNASAVATDNIQGSWSLSESYNDNSSFNVTLVFVGTHKSGTVTDSDGGSGTYTFNEGMDDEVVFTLVFPDVTYEYTGSFSDANTMSGTCKRYRTSDNVISGTWSASRITVAAAASSSSPTANPRRRRF
ncbi:MAG: hypothetical protein KJ808_06170 [Acidobacteria bacterium]|nr:hypothetical protein [Acidobacteriota bacterium]MBU4306478.1 hypothetical protein [Acidobacteriota bacterium]MBU4404333.1 hypothetical protein [Acidobacteriota bacterium]MCG2812437.1 hypothetical protein [Candidatus Aminicenantes bacterium]